MRVWLAVMLACGTAAADPGSIVANGRTTCVVRGGRAYCFGDLPGTWGYGHMPGASATPQPVAGLDDVAELALGSEHACVRRHTGAVACWGTLDDGTRGTNSPKGGYLPRVVAAPEPIAGIEASQLAAGAGFTCAIARDRTVACWGMNDGESLGRPGKGSLRPVRVAKLADAVELRAAGTRACARLASGQVWCWGDRSTGQPAPPRAVGELRGVTHLAMDQQQVCGLRAGHIICDRNPGYEEPVEATDLAISDSRRCVLRGSGEVACDDGNASHAVVAAGVHHAIAVAMGSDHACALERDGAVWCWGKNDAGQVGAPFTVIVSRPAAVAGVHDATRVAVAGMATCALRRGGEVWCWGGTSGGALAIATPEPYRASAARIPGITDATAIVGGGTHFCALTRRGTVACWGTHGVEPCRDAAAGQDCPTPAEVAGLTDAIDVSAARNGSCAVRATGAVVCWGQPSDLGYDDANWDGTPRVRDGIANAARVFNGYARTCVVRRDGTAACWGDDVTFQANAVRHSRQRIAEIAGVRDLVAIGRGQPDHALSRSGELRAFDWGNSFVPGGKTLAIAQPLPKVLVPDAVGMSQGNGETCAVRRSGKVVCWSNPETPTEVGIDDAVDVYVSESGTHCAVRRSGEVACWGENELGQCGVDPGAYVPVAHQVLGLPRP